MSEATPAEGLAEIRGSLRTFNFALDVRTFDDRPLAYALRRALTGGAHCLVEVTVPARRWLPEWYVARVHAYRGRDVLFASALLEQFRYDEAIQGPSHRFDCTYEFAPGFLLWWSSRAIRLGHVDQCLDCPEVAPLLRPGARLRPSWGLRIYPRIESLVSERTHALFR